MDSYRKFLTNTDEILDEIYKCYKNLYWRDALDGLAIERILSMHCEECSICQGQVAVT